MEIETQNIQMVQMKKLGNELYDFLKSNEYLKKSPHFNPNAEWLIKEREMCQLNSNSRILSFLNPPYDDFLNLCKQFDPCKTFEKELPIMKYTLLANIALFQHESLKRVFNIALNFNKIDSGSRHLTYGKIISKLKNDNLKDDIVNILNYELRNIFAHEDWYIEDDQLTYINNNSKHTISYNELSQSVNNFTHFSNAFYHIYWKNHLPPEAIEFSKQKIIEDRINYLRKMGIF